MATFHLLSQFWVSCKWKTEDSQRRRPPRRPHNNNNNPGTERRGTFTPINCTVFSVPVSVSVYTHICISISIHNNIITLNYQIHLGLAQGGKGTRTRKGFVRSCQPCPGNARLNVTLWQINFDLLRVRVRVSERLSSVSHQPCLSHVLCQSKINVHQTHTPFHH